MSKSFVRYSLDACFKLYGSYTCAQIVFFVSTNILYLALNCATLQLESNGTVLSTDWKEVGSKKVEGSPPEGMEVKKWEY